MFALYKLILCGRVTDYIIHPSQEKMLFPTSTKSFFKFYGSEIQREVYLKRLFHRFKVVQNFPANVFRELQNTHELQNSYVFFDSHDAKIILRIYLYKQKRYICAFVVPSKYAEVLRTANSKTRIFLQVKKKTPRRKCWGRKKRTCTGRTRVVTLGSQLWSFLSACPVL